MTMSDVTMQWPRLLSAQRLGHQAAEPVTPARNPFQKDWDRVVFCSAFRRLQDKTQVHSLPESDYVRTRLTHALAVAPVGRPLGAQEIGRGACRARVGKDGECSVVGVPSKEKNNIKYT